MKRRLPIIRKGEDALAASRLPPVTAQANRHRPSTAQPGSPAAAVNAAPTAATADRTRIRQRPHHIPAQLDGQRRETHRQLPGPRREPADPAPRRRMRHPRRGRRPADPARPARDLPDHRARRLGRVQPPDQDERRQQRMSHPAGPAPDPRNEDLPLPPPPADMPPVTRPEHHRHQARRALRPRHLTARPIDAYASTVSGHGHTMDMANHRRRSLLATGAKPGEEGSLR